MAGEVACVISGCWPTSPTPHPSVRVDEAASARSAVSPGLRAWDDRASTARAARPKPKSFKPRGERRRCCAYGSSGHQGAPVRRRAGTGAGAAAGAGASAIFLPSTGRGQGREVAV